MDGSKVNNTGNTDTIFKRNLVALSARDSVLSSRLRSCRPDTSIKFVVARTGMTIPAVTVNGRLWTFHSRFDPIKEGFRYLESSKKAGYLVFLGLGAGYHILPFLKAEHIVYILIIEKNLGEIRTILENIDMQDVLGEPKVTLLIDAGIDEIKETLRIQYIPSIAGNLHTIPLETRIRLKQQYYNDVIYMDTELYINSYHNQNTAAIALI